MASFVNVTKDETYNRLTVISENDDASSDTAMKDMYSDGVTAANDLATDEPITDVEEVRLLISEHSSIV